MLKNQPEPDYDVTFSKHGQKFILSNRLCEYEFLSLLTESDVMANWTVLTGKYTWNILKVPCLFKR